MFLLTSFDTKQTDLGYASCHWAKLSRSEKQPANQAASAAVAETVAAAVKQAEEWLR